MKNFLLAIVTSLSLVSAYATQASDPPKTKKVCRESVDKNGKKVQTCKTIKVHKKLEGKEVPKN